MEYVIRGIGILILVVGVVLSTMPSLMRSFIAFAKVGKRIYIGGVLRIVIGGLLLMASPQASNFWIPVILGSLIVLSGISIFILGTARIHAYMGWWEEKPDNTLRIGPIVASVLGILLIYSA